MKGMRKPRGAAEIRAAKSSQKEQFSCLEMGLSSILKWQKSQIFELQWEFHNLVSEYWYIYCLKKKPTIAYIFLASWFDNYCFIHILNLLGVLCVLWCVCVPSFCPTGTHAGGPSVPLTLNRKSRKYQVALAFSFRTDLKKSRRFSRQQLAFRQLMGHSCRYFIFWPPWEHSEERHYSEGRYCTQACWYW